MPSEPRRSGRTRKANTKYTNDGWDKDTLRLLRESTESSSAGSVVSGVDDEVEQRSDGGFNEQDAAEVSAGDDGLSVRTESGKSSSVATPENNIDEDEDLIVSEDGSRAGPRTKWKQPTQLHARGVVPVERGRSVKGGVWQSMFGPEVEDLKPMLQARDRWLFNARDVTLPSRKSIQQAREHDWTRYCGENGTLAHDARDPSQPTGQQKLSQISAEEAKSRSFLVDCCDHQIVLGPWTQQQQYALPFLEPVDLGQAWKMDANVSDSLEFHSGWLVNMGEKPQCMAWAPSQNEHQYLAIACRSVPEQRNRMPRQDSKVSPAFSPSMPYPSSIYIWRFSLEGDGTNHTAMSSKRPPELVQILGCSFGDFKQLAWTPNPGSDRADHSDLLGLLTVLNTDGCARLIHVSRPNASPAKPTYYNVVQPSLKIMPPSEAVFTCFTYASPTDLILGLSSGHIHAYNVDQPIISDDTIQPYYTHQLHHTYVLSLCTTGNEDSGHFLASTSAAGTLKLTDLRSPSQDNISLPRARIPSRNLIASPHTYAIITSIDNSGNTEPRGNAQTTVVAHGFRHFYTSQALSRYPEGSGISTALAGSPLHPYILAGHSNGTVWSQNVIRRILPTGKVGSANDAGAWVQKVVDFEWRKQPSANDMILDETQDSNIDPSLYDKSGRYFADLYNGSPVRPGVSRMHHGFKIERLDLSNSGSKKRKSAASGPNGEGAIHVVFEEEQAVTSIEWNVNPVAAAWAAIGWGSGVVWITDLAHDA